MIDNGFFDAGHKMFDWQICSWYHLLFVKKFLLTTKIEEGAMPVVWIQRDPRFIGDEDLVKIGKQLMTLVAYHLDIPDNPEGRLEPMDIIIRPQDIHPLAINNQPLEIIVFAHDFPERRKGIDAKAEIIAEEIRSLLPGRVLQLMTKGFVWIYLGHTGFSRIP